MLLVSFLAERLSLADLDAHSRLVRKGIDFSDAVFRDGGHIRGKGEFQTRPFGRTRTVPVPFAVVVGVDVHVAGDRRHRESKQLKSNAINGLWDARNTRNSRNGLGL